MWTSGMGSFLAASAKRACARFAVNGIPVVKEFAVGTDGQIDFFFCGLDGSRAGLREFKFHGVRQKRGCDNEDDEQDKHHVD